MMSYGEPAAGCWGTGRSFGRGLPLPRPRPRPRPRPPPLPLALRRGREPGGPCSITSAGITACTAASAVTRACASAAHCSAAAARLKRRCSGVTSQRPNAATGAASRSCCAASGAVTEHSGKPADGHSCTVASSAPPACRLTADARATATRTVRARNTSAIGSTARTHTPCAGGGSAAASTASARVGSAFPRKSTPADRGRRGGLAAWTCHSSSGGRLPTAGAARSPAVMTSTCRRTTRALCLCTAQNSSPASSAASPPPLLALLEPELRPGPLGARVLGGRPVGQRSAARISSSVRPV